MNTKAITLIEEAEKLKTTLDELRVIHFYEGIYFLMKRGDINRGDARNLYRYRYYLTKKEKRGNPNWEDFCDGMDRLYPQIDWNVQDLNSMDGTIQAPEVQTVALV